MLSVGVDVGGTKCLAIGLSENGERVGASVAPTASGLGIVDQLADVMHQFPGADSLGIGMPGIVGKSGTVHLAPHLPEIRNLPLQQLLEDRLSLPVFIDNDATCAAIAEWRVGAARGLSDVLVVTIGTGIGGGIIAGGRVVRGAHGFAGEIGHHIIVSGGEPCPCGRSGCWEQYASGNALRRIAHGVSGEEIISRVAAGDGESMGFLNESAHWIALGLFNLINTLDPECVVLGGGLGSSPSLLPLVDAALDAMMPSSVHRPRPKLCPAQLGHEAGAIGAAYLGRVD